MKGNLARFSKIAICIPLLQFSSYKYTCLYIKCCLYLLLLFIIEKSLNGAEETQVLIKGKLLTKIMVNPDDGIVG